MTRKQQLFCDYYLVDLNATQAAIKAGYSKKTAKQIGQENLTKPDVKAFIEQRVKQKTQFAIADQDEALKTLTNIIRCTTSKDSDRIRACELLGKYHNIWNGDKVDVKATVTIVNDIPKKA
jgi:phage terminase small subunit